MNGQRLQVFLGILLVLLVVWLAGHGGTRAGGLFLLLAVGLVAAHMAKLAGRWALIAAAAAAVLALPFVLLSGFRLGMFFIAALIRLVPLALIVLGVYVVFRAVGRARGDR